MASFLNLVLSPPSPFNFEYTAYSHGWVVLAPNVWDEKRNAVRRVEHLTSGQVVLLEISGSESADKPEIDIQVEHQVGLTRDEQDEISASVGHMFRLDEDLSEFYELCVARGEPWLRLTTGLGRLLRSPTVWEDVVKTICTTNIQWGGTKRMVSGLVEAYGEPYPTDTTRRAFPRPEALVAATSETIADSVRLGYRAPYIYELAQRITSGELDLESYRDAELTTPELKKALLAIKGVGNYAAATLLMLLGRYDELAVDTVYRQFVSQKYFAGERPTDEETQAIYEDWGQWKYLAYWFDIWQGLGEEL